MTAPVRWGILGTANIARKSLLPAVAAAGGVAQVVGSRSTDRAAAWAAEHGVARGTDYEGVLTADDVDAIYVALPNDRHVEWAARAAATGKAVLCEKPLALDAAEVHTLVDGLDAGARVWEAFVFPFHPQTQHIASLLPELGDPLQLFSEFHFSLPAGGNIRWDATGGGALYDVGCYSIRLARLLFGTEPDAAHGSAVRNADGVDTSSTAVLDFPDERRLLLSASIQRPFSTRTRVVGTRAELHVDNPFHPKPGDTVTLVRDGEVVDTWTADERLAFAHGVAHVQAVVAGTEAPRHTVLDDGLAQARALDLVRAAVDA
ncbi:Predicted dehydrogenase [Jatrophihabitans endophyticus]|uniref:Predicted dehydrogenase n=1 Tax=Jatrophihabitans endophyticus TaxID=1206085 RepID=A0A1M5P7H5_9ACTN|nr:Gfo/Idh/MocA family oxidoreductase [Jatrophihabitans endophyticus]SHG97173.1 Predicted dehydrogenase [Jatrophihabitans endophyticus]